MEKTVCDRCEKEIDFQKFKRFTGGSGENQKEAHNKFVFETTKRLVRRDAKWFGWFSLAQMIGRHKRYQEATRKIDICSECQDSFDKWLENDL